MKKVNVMIMGQPYTLSCKADEETALREAVDYLDQRMCGIRDGGKIKGNDRIAVMAALSIAADLLTAREDDAAAKMASPEMKEAEEKIMHMHAVLDSALTPQEKLF